MRIPKNIRDQLRAHEQKRDTCPNVANHTNPPDPCGWVLMSAWAKKMAKTHKQTQCPSCGLWAIWIKKETPNV